MHTHAATGHLNLVYVIGAMLFVFGIIGMVIRHDRRYHDELQSRGCQFDSPMFCMRGSVL